MNSTFMIRQTLEANKKIFEESFNAMSAFQEHAENMMRLLWGRSLFLPPENNKIRDDWGSHCKNCLEEFKKSIDLRFKLMEDYFLNTAEQVESSLNAAGEKTIPVNHVTEVTKTPKAEKLKDGASEKGRSRRKKRNVMK